FSDAPRCPFCSADVPTDVAAPRPLKARLGRAALFVAGAAFAAACSSEGTPTSDGGSDAVAQGTGGSGAGGFQIGPLYGAPVIGTGGQGTGGSAYGAGGRAGTGGEPDGTGGTPDGTGGA